MSQGAEQTRDVPKDLSPPGWKINGWKILGLFCMVASAFLSVGILFEVLEFLKATGIAETLPFPR